MFGFNKHFYPIGIDMGDDIVKVVQLGRVSGGMSLIAGGSEVRPEDIEPGSVDWHSWAISSVRKLISNSNFRGKGVSAVLPAREVFIDHIKIPSIRRNVLELVVSRVRQKFGCDPENAVIKYFGTE